MKVELSIKDTVIGKIADIPLHVTIGDRKFAGLG